MTEKETPNKQPPVPSGSTGETTLSTAEPTAPQSSTATPDSGTPSSTPADASPVPQIVGQPYVALSKDGAGMVFKDGSAPVPASGTPNPDAEKPAGGTGK